MVRYQNIYSFKDHRHSSSECPAGVHISFTKPAHIHRGDKEPLVTVNTLFDFVQVFKALDVAFKDEIIGAKRNPGFYEIKTDGRIEYRSLPSNVDMDKIIKVVNAIIKKA